MLPLKGQRVTQTYNHLVLAGSHFLGRVNQSGHKSNAAHGASNLRFFGYEFYALSNCAITAKLHDHSQLPLRFLWRKGCPLL